MSRFRYGWTLESERWAELRAKMTDCEWKRVYLEEEYAASVPNTPGVYMICACAKDAHMTGRVMEQLYNVVYAGKADDLRRRFKNHTRGYGKVLHAMSIFSRLHFWHTEYNQDAVTQAEDFLLRTFGPAANVNYASSIRAQIGEPISLGGTK